MESATASPASAGVGSETIADLLPKSVAKYGPSRAVMFKDGSGRWSSRTYEEVGETVKQLSLGLMALGIEKGDKVAILGNTRPEWTYFDFAALTAGATVVPIYQTNSPEECEYVLENSDAVAVIVEDEEQLEKIRAVRNRCPKLEHVMRMTGKGGGAISSDELVERDARVRLHQRLTIEPCQSQRLGGAAASLHLQREPEDNERRHDDGDVVVDLAQLLFREERWCGECDARVEPGDARSDRDQRVHVRLAVAQRPPSAGEELGARVGEDGERRHADHDPDGAQLLAAPRQPVSEHGEDPRVAEYHRRRADGRSEPPLAKQRAVLGLRV